MQYLDFLHLMEFFIMVDLCIGAWIYKIHVSYISMVVALLVKVYL